MGLKCLIHSSCSMIDVIIVINSYQSLYELVTIVYLFKFNWFYLYVLFWEYWNICSTCHHYPLDPISCLKLLSSSLVTAYVHLHAEKTSQMTDTQLTSSAHTGELCANISTCEYCPYQSSRGSKTFTNKKWFEDIMH